MNRLQATSRCECQALLNAILDEKRQVIEGSARLHGAKEIAPAHSIGAAHEHFDIGWLCPFCGRNTLRTFYAGALRAAPAVDAPALTPALTPAPSDAKPA
jgi:hypothetical protein